MKAEAAAAMEAGWIAGLESDAEPKEEEGRPSEASSYQGCRDANSGIGQTARLSIASDETSITTFCLLLPGDPASGTPLLAVARRGIQQKHDQGYRGRRGRT